MKILINNRNVDFSKFQIPDSFVKTYLLSDDVIDNRPYLLDYDALKLDKLDLFWLLKNNVNCVILVSGKSWENIKEVKGEKGVTIVNDSEYTNFFAAMKMIVQGGDRDKVYRQLLLDETSTIVIQRWLLSMFPTDPVVMFLDTVLENPEIYYKTLSYCFTPRLKIPTYKLHKPSEEEENLRRRVGGTFWEMKAYRKLLEK